MRSSDAFGVELDLAAGERLRKSTTGKPMPRHSVLWTTLSMPSAEPSTPEPTYGTLGQLEQALDGAVLAVGAVQDGKHEVEAAADAESGPSGAALSWHRGRCGQARAASSAGSLAAVLAGGQRPPAGRPPTSQRPACVMPIGTTSWPACSSASITARADCSETSCSPERPPKATATRRRRWSGSPAGLWLMSAIS